MRHGVVGVKGHLCHQLEGGCAGQAAPPQHQQTVHGRQSCVQGGLGGEEPSLGGPGACHQPGGRRGGRQGEGALEELLPPTVPCVVTHPSLPCQHQPGECNFSILQEDCSCSGTDYRRFVAVHTSGGL